MMNDITGKRFGIRTVIGDSGQRHKSSGGVLWLVRCDCGVEKLLTGYGLRKGNSCGCQKVKRHSQTMRTLLNRGGYAEIFASHWNEIKKQAKRRKLTFGIDAKYAWELFLSQNRKCAISGLPIGFSTNCQGKHSSASLDRIDSSNGYVKGNVQWVYKKINMMKQDYSMKDFLDLCKKVCLHNNL